MKKTHVLRSLCQSPYQSLYQEKAAGPGEVIFHDNMDNMIYKLFIYIYIALYQIRLCEDNVFDNMSKITITLSLYPHYHYRRG